MTLITKAFAMADASVLAPFDFLRLPAVALLAFVIFAEIPAAQTWLGASIIIAAAVVASHHAGQRKRSRVVGN